MSKTNKINVNWNSVIKWSVISAISLLIVSIILKIKMLFIAAELVIFILMMSMIFSAIYSLLVKFDNKNKK